MNNYTAVYKLYKQAGFWDDAGNKIKQAWDSYNDFADKNQWVRPAIYGLGGAGAGAGAGLLMKNPVASVMLGLLGGTLGVNAGHIHNKHRKSSVDSVNSVDSSGKQQFDWDDEEQDRKFFGQDYKTQPKKEQSKEPSKQKQDKKKQNVITVGMGDKILAYPNGPQVGELTSQQRKQWAQYIQGKRKSPPSLPKQLENKSNNSQSKGRGSILQPKLHNNSIFDAPNNRSSIFQPRFKRDSLLQPKFKGRSVLQPNFNNRSGIIDF